MSGIVYVDEFLTTLLEMPTLLHKQLMDTPS